MAIKSCGKFWLFRFSIPELQTGTEPHPAVVGQSGVAGRGAGAAGSWWKKGGQFWPQWKSGGQCKIMGCWSLQNRHNSDDQVIIMIMGYSCWMLRIPWDCLDRKASLGCWHDIVFRESAHWRSIGHITKWSKRLAMSEAPWNWMVEFQESLTSSISKAAIFRTHQCEILNRTTIYHDEWFPWVSSSMCYLLTLLIITIVVVMIINITIDMFIIMKMYVYIYYIYIHYIYIYCSCARFQNNIIITRFKANTYQNDHYYYCYYHVLLNSHRVASPAARWRNATPRSCGWIESWRVWAGVLVMIWWWRCFFNGKTIGKP